MAQRFSPQDLLRAIRSLRFADLLLEQTQDAFRVISIALDRHQRKEPEPKGEIEAVEKSLAWFAYWFFDDRRPTLKELAELFDSHVLPKARMIAERYGELAEAATQYNVVPEPFLQLRSLINAFADGMLRTQGQSLADHYRDALRILHETGVGGVPAHTAAHGAVNRLEEAATQKLLDEARALPAREALELLEPLGETIDRCQKRAADFTNKWAGRRPGADLSLQERKEFTTESESVFAHRLENHVATAQRAAVMERIAEVLPQYDLDPTPVKDWIQFMRKVAEMPDRLEAETDEQFRKRVKRIERDCGLDMAAVNAVLTDLCRVLQPEASDAAPVVGEAKLRELSFDDVMQTADEFSAALLGVWRLQRQTEALTTKHSILEADAWPAEAKARANEFTERSRRAWNVLREKGRILYHVAIQWGAGEEFLMLLAYRPPC